MVNGSVLTGWRRAGLSLVVVVVQFATAGAAKAEQPASLAAAMPPGAVAFVEISDLDTVLDRAEKSSWLKMATESDGLLPLAQSEPYRKAQAARQIVERHFGVNLWTAGKRLLGGRVGVALYLDPNRPEPGVILLIEGADAKLLAKIRERIEPFLVLADKQIKKHQTIEGTTILELDDRAFIAAYDDRIIAASGKDLLTQTAARLAGNNDERSLADDESFRIASEQMGTGHLLRAYVNTTAINKLAGGRYAPQKLGNPLFSLLVGGMMEMAVRSPYAGATLDLKDDHLLLTAIVAGGPQSLGPNYAVYFSDPAGRGTAPLVRPRDLIGGFTIYRNFATWYGHREQLLEARLLPGFDEFESGLGNLLPGMDFEQEVLPLLGNRVTFVAAPQDYSHLGGEPGVKFPGLAAVIELAKPRESGDMLRLFFQTICAVLNIQAGQQARQPWLMSSEDYQGVQISYGRYLSKPAGERLPLLVNFVPVSAQVGDKFILSSSLDLCRQLVDELKRPPAAGKSPNRNFNFELHTGPLADILQANQDFFHARMIQGGRDAEEAKKRFTAILTLLRSFKSIELSTSVKSDSFQVRLLGSWK